MRKGWIHLLLLAALLTTTGCVPMLRMSPNPDTVILLPEGSKAATVEHFQRQESQLMWLFTGIRVVPTDYLAQVAPNKPLRNVRYKQELDFLHYILTYAAATAAGVATAVYAPTDYKGLGLLVYFGLVLALPQKINTEIEGDVAESPSDLGQGR